MIKIYCTDNSERAEIQSSNRGYRPDIYVETVNGDIYNLRVYDMVRLQQDFEGDLEYRGFFVIDPNVILVRDVIISNIKLTIQELFNRNYFEYLKPIDSGDIDVKELIEV